MKKTFLTLSVLAFAVTPALAGGMGGCNSANKAHLAQKSVAPVEPVAQMSPMPEAAPVEPAAIMYASLLPFALEVPVIAVQ
jgi:hypothetical protein